MLFIAQEEVNTLHEVYLARFNFFQGLIRDCTLMSIGISVGMLCGRLAQLWLVGVVAAGAVALWAYGRRVPEAEAYAVVLYLNRVQHEGATLRYTGDEEKLNEWVQRFAVSTVEASNTDSSIQRIAQKFWQDKKMLALTI